MNPQLRLQNALKSQDPAAVRAAVAAGADPNAGLPNGHLPLLSVWAPQPEDDTFSLTTQEMDAKEQAYRRRGYALMKVLFELGARADSTTPKGAKAFRVFMDQELSGFCTDAQYHACGEPNVEESLAMVRLWMDQGASPVPESPEHATVLDYAEHLSYMDAVDDHAFTESHVRYVGQLIPLLVEYGYPEDQLLAKTKIASGRPDYRYGHLMEDQVIAQCGMMEGYEYNSPAYHREQARRDALGPQIMRDLIEEGLRLRDLRVRETADPQMVAASAVAPEAVAVSPQQALQNALEAQDAAAIQAAVSQGANPNALLPNGLLPLLAVWHALPGEWGEQGSPRTNAEERVFRQRAHGLMKVLFEQGARANGDVAPGVSAFFTFVRTELESFCYSPERTHPTEPDPADSLAAIRLWLSEGARPHPRRPNAAPDPEAAGDVLDHADWLSYLNANNDLGFTPSHVAFVRDLTLLLVEHGFPADRLLQEVEEAGDRHRLRYSHLASDQYEARHGQFPVELVHGTPAYAQEWARRDAGERQLMTELATEGERLQHAREHPETTASARRRRRPR